MYMPTLSQPKTTIFFAWPSGQVTLVQELMYISLLVHTSVMLLDWSVFGHASELEAKTLQAYGWGKIDQRIGSAYAIT